jgi:hypothetical protein
MSKIKIEISEMQRIKQSIYFLLLNCPVTSLRYHEQKEAYERAQILLIELNKKY